MNQRFVLLAACLAIASITPSPLIADELQTVSKRLAKGLSHLKTKRIAVLPFVYHNGDCSTGSSYVSERLTTLMVERGGAEVVERELLDKAMDEIKFGMTGALDPQTTQKLGKLLGVNAIVSGTLIDLEDRVTEINARLIQTETGSILSAATAQIRRTWDDLPRAPAQRRAQAKASGQEYHLNMSPLIPTSMPKRRPVTPIYQGPMQPIDPDRPPPPGVLTLTNDDLIPVEHRGQSDPERVVDHFLQETGPAPEAHLHMARRIYHRNPDAHIRGRALLAMGHLLERSGQPAEAAEAYHQALREFPDAPVVDQEAQQRLDVLGK